ncbi:MAG: MBL fold metallo-hydrolase [Acidimicrobiales bacterium]|nr:MBL fold metallo-hydrolase [Acidimicrobiales bacterium]
MEPQLRSRPLDELTLTVVVDNETDTLSTVDKELPQVPELIGHMGRIAPTTSADGHDCFEVFGELCVACHGYSAVAEGRIGDETHTVLFDAGPYEEVWLDNAARLDIDLAAIEVVFLSHWHWDHSGALPAAAKVIAEARAAAGLPPPVVDLHPDRPDQRGTKAASGAMVLLPNEPRFEAFSSAGGEVTTSAEPHTFAGDFFLGSGAIERRTRYEVGLIGHHSFREGVGEPDPLIMDERFLAAEVKGRGVTVMSACSHAGIVNACMGARDHFADTPVDLVLGGFHLAGGAVESRIADTVADLAGVIDPTIVAPGHCTGWRAKAALADRFAPDRYAPSVVGTTYRLTAH